MPRKAGTGDPYSYDPRATAYGSDSINDSSSRPSWRVVAALGTVRRITLRGRGS